MEQNAIKEELMEELEEKKEISEEIDSNDPKETKADKSRRLAEARMNKLIQCFEQLKKLSNRSSYEFTQEQIDVMCAVIDKQCSVTKQLFMEMTAPEKKFSFDKP